MYNIVYKRLIAFFKFLIKYLQLNWKACEVMSLRRFKSCSLRQKIRLLNLGSLIFYCIGKIEDFDYTTTFCSN